MIFKKTKGACSLFLWSSSVDKKRNLDRIASLDEAENPLKKEILLLFSN